MRYLTLTEYAKKHGISRQTARWRMLKGKIKVTRVGKFWMVVE